MRTVAGRKALNKTALGALVLAISVTTILGTASAQDTPPPPASYPSSQYPQPQPNQYPPPNAYQPAPPQKAHPVRDLFVGTLSAIIQAATGGAVSSITQGVTGSITNWFDRKARKNAQQQYAQSYYPPAPGTTDPYATASQYPQPASQYPQQSYPQPATSYPPAQYPQDTTNPQGQATYPQTQSTYPQDSQYPVSTYPGTTPYPGDPNAASAYQSAPLQVYDPSTGQVVDASGSVYGGATAAGYDSSTLYAGFAYEVHALGPGNTSTPVNAATHQFRSGDRFMVHFRPSLPGQLEVYNINPFGQQTRIDSVSVAAGQLTSLGPYEFAGTKGDESLRLVLAPCSTPQLLTQTRDIVNVSQSASGGVALSSCGLATRSVRTRDIQKVALDGGTNYALDPVSQTELSSGEMASREVTIVFRHN